jgi:hypothetical protein
MKKIGRIKSWYIDSDDNRFTLTQHNILFENDNYCIVARHDDIESDDFDAVVEIGTFELNGKSYNARFSDIYGRMNYTNIKE